MKSEYSKQNNHSRTFIDTLMKYVIYNVKFVLLIINKLFTNHGKWECLIIRFFRKSLAILYKKVV